MWLVKAPGVGLLVEGHRDKEVEVKDGPVLVLQVGLVPAPGVAGGGRWWKVVAGGGRWWKVVAGWWSDGWCQSLYITKIQSDS